MPGSPTFRLHLRRDSPLDQPPAATGHKENTRLQGDLRARRRPPIEAVLTLASVSP